jgi:hypothetical protein
MIYLTNTLIKLDNPSENDKLVLKKWNIYSNWTLKFDINSQGFIYIVKDLYKLLCKILAMRYNLWRSMDLYTHTLDLNGLNMHITCTSTNLHALLWNCTLKLWKLMDLMYTHGAQCPLNFHKWLASMDLHGFMWNHKAPMWRKVLLMHKLQNFYGVQWICASSWTISMEPNGQMCTL